MSSKNHHIPKYLGERKLNWEQWLVHDKFLAMFLSRWMNCSCQWRNYSVLLPDLRKEFEVPPYSQSVELGSQIELRCHPPQGKPKPRVSNCWANVQLQVHVGSTVSNQDIQLSVHFLPNYIWSPCMPIFLWFTITLCSTDGTFKPPADWMLSVNRRLSPLCIEMIFYILSRHASHKKLSDDKCQANDCLTSSFQIYWVRDGVEVQPERDPNFLQASDGHLIIVQVWWIKYSAERNYVGEVTWDLCHRIKQQT